MRNFTPLVMYNGSSEAGDHSDFKSAQDMPEFVLGASTVMSLVRCLTEDVF